MYRPLISICTPCNRVIPWFNLRIVNICSQDFDDWEWIVFDNSTDGCVKKYIEDFFENNMNIKYLHCREKIRCIWNPMDFVSIADGRVGLLKNACISLSECDENGYIFMLDSDDFIFNHFLKNIADIVSVYPDVEGISGMYQQGLAQNLNDGMFYYHKLYRNWVYDYHSGFVAALDKYNFDGNGYKEFLTKLHNNDMFDEKITECKHSLSFSDYNVDFVFDEANTINDEGYTFFSKFGFGHPIVFKKSAFLKKIQKYYTFIKSEDMICTAMQHILDKIVYIETPCYLNVMMIDDNWNRNSTSAEAVKVDNQIEQETTDLMLYITLKKSYENLGNCMNCKQPIRYKPIN